MSSIATQTIAGFNEQVQTLRSLEEKYPEQRYIITLVTFNHEIDTVLYARPVRDLQPLTSESYQPLGSTALNDAIGLTMTRIEGEGKEELADKNNSVVVTIFTDGLENDSKTEFKDTGRVAALIDRLQKTEQFTFTYVGANQDAIAVAKDLSISVSNVLNYAASESGTREAFARLNTATKKYSRRMASGVEGAALCSDFFDDEKP
jgi:uncharacterized protein YegL